MHFSERFLREVYFPAFRAAVQEGGAQSLMTAHTAIDGVPCSNNAWLMASCDMKDSDPSGQTREFGFNVSAVLKKEKAGWRIQALHTSNVSGDEGPPPEEAAPAATPAPAPAPAPETAPKKAQ